MRLTSDEKRHSSFAARVSDPSSIIDDVSKRDRNVALLLKVKLVLQLEDRACRRTSYLQAVCTTSIVRLAGCSFSHGDNRLMTLLKDI